MAGMSKADLLWLKKFVDNYEYVVEAYPELFEMDDIDDMKVAVSEACTNTIDHAFPADDESSPKPSPVLIRFIPRPGELRVEVEDVGKGFDPDRIQVDLSKGPPVEGGLGLYLIHQLTDTAEVQSAPGSGTKVIMTKRSAR